MLDSDAGMSMSGSSGGGAMGGMFFDKAMDFMGMKVAQEYRGQDRKSEQDFAKGMYEHRYQMQMEDMRKAGLNPILAASQGAPGAPAGGSGGSYSKGSSASAMQVAALQAQTSLLEAQASKTVAEQKEIEERTPTHAVSIDVMRQNIRESVERLNRIVAETSREYATADMYTQSVVNMKETIPQIQATVRNLESVTKLNTALHGKTLSETKEIQQRVARDLPQLKAALEEMALQAQRLDMPRREQESSAHDRFVGAMGAVMRILNPLNGFLK